MAIEEIVEYQRILMAGLNRGDLSVVDQIFSPDLVFRTSGIATPLRGIEGWKQFIAGVLAAFPDAKFSVEDQVLAGERAVFRWHAVGTHTGPLGAAPATGKTISIDGIVVDRLVGGKVIERWEQWDQPLMLQQLGFA